MRQVLWHLAVSVLVLTAVQSSRLDGRRARMPNFGDQRTLRHYSSYKPGNTISSSGFRLPASVNHLKVKTNSSNPYKNEKNVTLNLNIPASVSGFLLEEIDLKYVKKSRKKSIGNKNSNLLIKYFTNRSSNLHLSSVTKQEVDAPPLYQGNDLKETRGQGPLDYDGNDRPFRYQNKYPLRLQQKNKRKRNLSNTFRRGKLISQETTDNELESSSENKLSHSSEELSESDLLALESILSSKTVFKAHPERILIQTENITESDDDVSLKEAYEVFEDAAEDSIVKSYQKKARHKQSENPTMNFEIERKIQSTKIPLPTKKENLNWFSRLFTSFPSFSTA